MKTSEALYAAADYIREHGWSQGALGNHGGPRCMIGALASVDSMHELTGDEYVEARDRMDAVCGIGAAIFNDAHCKTRRDAIAALEIAADIAAAEGL